MKNEPKKDLHVKNNTKILSPGRFEKQYLISALSTRIFKIGLEETKSVKSAIQYFKKLDGRYQGLISPFYFEKVLKHQGKYFWNPFIPMFYGRAFERYVQNEFDNVDQATEAHDPGVTYIDFTSCGSRSRLNTTLDLLMAGKYKMHDSMHKIYVRWAGARTLNYILGKYFSTMSPAVEKWLVIDSSNRDLPFDFLVEKGLKGVILNLADEDLQMLYHENTGYDKTPLSALLLEMRMAGLLVGINMSLNGPDPDKLYFMMKNVKDLMANFMIWNEYNNNPNNLDDESKLNRATLERMFLKSNSSKEFSNFPLIFFPDFFKRLRHKDNSQSKKFSHITFINSTMVENRSAYYEMFRDMLTPSGSVIPKVAVMSEPVQIVTRMSKQKAG